MFLSYVKRDTGKGWHARLPLQPFLKGRISLLSLVGLFARVSSRLFVSGRTSDKGGRTEISAVNPDNNIVPIFSRIYIGLIIALLHMPTML
jgi:hypothetical protein